MFINVIMNWEEFNRRYSELTEMVDCGRGRETCVGAAIFFRYAGMLLGEPLYMELVNDCFMPWRQKTWGRLDRPCLLNHLSKRRESRSILIWIQNRVVPN